jgi:hypothetical protein
LTPLDAEEQQLRIDQMTIDIEKMRADLRQETRKFIIWFVLAIAAAVAAGVAITNYVNNRSPQIPPGTVITVPK